MAAGGRSLPWPYVGLGVAALVAVALTLLALRDPAPPPATISVQPPADATPEAAAEITAEATSAGGVEAPADVPVQREVPLAVLSARSAVRADPGSCPGGGAALEVTDDQGRSWEGLPVPTDQLLRVARTGERDLWFVGAARAECAPAFTSTEDGGSTWVGPSDTTGAWHLEVDPGARALHAPYATVDSPCGRRSTIELEPTSFEAAWVLCADGEVFSTVNAGTTWTSAGRAPGAVALGVLSDQPVVAVPSSGDCSGLAIGAPGSTALGCVAGATPTGVALAFAGAPAGFVVADGATWTSNDGGTTWTRRE